MHAENEDMIELKSTMAKKKTKFIFYSERLIKLYKNGCFAYYGAKSGSLKTMIKPNELVSVTYEGKDKMRIVLKNKKIYLFKLSFSIEA